MLIIRLQRAGKKNKADFRLVLAQKTAASQKKFTEVMGSYNPHTKNLQIRDQERLNYWVNDQHVEVSPTAYNLLVAKEIIKGDKKKAFTIPKKEVVAEEPAAEAPVSAEGAAVEEPATEAVPAEETAASEPAAETPAEAEAPTVEPVAEEPAAEPTPESTEPAETTESQE